MPLSLSDIWGPGLYIGNPADTVHFLGQTRISLNIQRSPNEDTGCTAAATRVGEEPACRTAAGPL